MRRDAYFLAHDICVDYPDAQSSMGLWGRRLKRAVHHAQVILQQQQTLAIVGESGSGKSSLARVLAQLVRPSTGFVRLRDTNLTELYGTPPMRHHRHRLQMIFQDSWASLDAHQTIGSAIAEPMLLGPHPDKNGVAERSQALMNEVGLDTALFNRLPHALSGGQRQRVNIARAIASNPEIIVADEPTSALDLSMKGQVLFMLQKLVERRRMGLIFISHDLAAVRFISQRVSVMYAGRIVESGETEAVLKWPKHPYTQALLEAAPSLHPEHQRSRLHRGLTSGPAAPPAPRGCPFAGQCPQRFEPCLATMPVLIEDPTGHAVACHRD